MATEDEAREAADGTEVQVEAVDLGKVDFEAHPEVKLPSIREIKNVGENIDSAEGTLKIPEDQVLVEAPSEVELPLEHNLNGKASSLNGHMDKEEKISNEQPHENDQEEAELDGTIAHQSNGISKEEVTDSLSHGESTAEDNSLLKHEKDEEPSGDDQQDLGVTEHVDSVQVHTLKTESATEKTDDGQQDQNQEPEKANEDTQPSSTANNADVEVVAEAPSVLQTPEELNLDDSGTFPGTINEKMETEEPDKADGVVCLDHKEGFPEETSTTEEAVKVEDQQSSVAFEDAILEDQHNLSVTMDNDPVQEDTLKAIEQKDDGQQDQDRGPEKTTDDTQPASMENIPDVEVVAEAPSGVQTPVEPNLENHAISDTIDGNIETDEPNKADGVVHPDHKERFPEDTSIAEPAEEVVKVEDQQSQQADAMDADAVQEDVPKSEHADEPETNAHEVLNQESTEETDGPVNEKTEESVHQRHMADPEETTPENNTITVELPVNIQVPNQESVEEIEDVEAVDTEAAMQQSTVAFEEAIPEDQHNLGITMDGDTVQENTLEVIEQTEDVPDLEVVAEAPSGVQTPVAINLDNSDAIPDTADGNTETDESAKAEDAIATSEPQVTEEQKDIETAEAQEITEHSNVTPSKELSAEDNSTADEPHNDDSQQTLGQDSVEVKETVFTSEDNVEDNVTAEDPTCDSQEVDNAESTEETKGNTAENIAEVSDIVIVDAVEEQNLLETGDIAKTHMRELEPEETKNTKPIEPEEASDQRNAILFDDLAQDNTPESEMQQTESATETTETEAAPQESNGCVSEETSPEDHKIENETECDTQEVSITESLEVIDGGKDSITGGSSGQSNMVSAGVLAQENNVFESEPTADIQPVQEPEPEPEEIKNIELAEVKETSHEIQAPNEEDNPATVDLHESARELSNIEATEVGTPHQNNAAQSEEQAPEGIASEPQVPEPESVEEMNDTEATEPPNISQGNLISTSGESVPEEIATEDKTSTELDVDHQQLQDQESTDFMETEADKPQGIASSSTLSTSEQSTSEDNETAKEPSYDTQAENSEPAEVTEGAENVESNTALAEAEAPEEHVETDATADTSSVKEPELEETKDAEPAGTEDIMTSSDLPAENMGMETMGTEAVPRESHVETIKELTEDDTTAEETHNDDTQQTLGQDPDEVKETVFTSEDTVDGDTVQENTLEAIEKTEDDSQGHDLGQEKATENTPPGTMASIPDAIPDTADRNTETDESAKAVDATATSEPQVTETEDEPKDTEVIEAQEIIEHGHVTPSKELSAEDDSIADEPHNDDIQQTLGQDLVEVKEIVFTSEDNVEGNVAEEEPTCDSQEVDNAESAEETKRDTAEPQVPEPESVEEMNETEAIEPPNISQGNLISTSGESVPEEIATEDKKSTEPDGDHQQDEELTDFMETEADKPQGIASSSTLSTSEQSTSEVNETAKEPSADTQAENSEPAEVIEEAENVKTNTCLAEAAAPEEHVETDATAETSSVQEPELEEINDAEPAGTEDIMASSDLPAENMDMETMGTEGVPHESHVESIKELTVDDTEPVLDLESVEDTKGTDTMENPGEPHSSTSDEPTPTEENTTVTECDTQQVQNVVSQEIKDSEDTKTDEFSDLSSFPTLEEADQESNLPRTEPTTDVQQEQELGSTEETTYIESVGAEDHQQQGVTSLEEPAVDSEPNVDDQQVLEDKEPEVKSNEAMEAEEVVQQSNIDNPDDATEEKSELRSDPDSYAQPAQHVELSRDSENNQLVKPDGPSCQVNTVAIEETPTEDSFAREIDPPVEHKQMEEINGIDANVAEEEFHTSQVDATEKPASEGNVAPIEPTDELNEETMGNETGDVMSVPGTKDEIQTSVELKDGACDLGETVLITEGSENVTDEAAVQSPGDDILETSNNIDQVKEEQKDGCEHNSSEMSGVQNVENIIHVQDRDVSGEPLTKRGSEEASQALFESDPQGAQDAAKEDDSTEGGEQTSDLSKQPDDEALQLQTCEADALSIGKQDEVVQNVDLDQQQKEDEEIGSQKEELQADEQKHEDKGSDFAMEPHVEPEYIENSTKNRKEDAAEAEQTEASITEILEHEEAPHVSEESTASSMNMKVDNVKGTHEVTEEDADTKNGNKDEETAEKNDIVATDSTNEHDETTDEITNEELEPGLASSRQEVSDPAPSNDDILENDPAAVTRNVESGEHSEDTECADKVNDDVHIIQATEEEITGEINEKSEIRNEDNAINHDESETKPQEEEASQLHSDEPCNMDAKIDDATTLGGEIINGNASIKPSENEDIGENKGLDSTSEPFVESSVQNNVEQDLSSHQKVEDEKLSMAEQNDIDTEAASDMQEKADESASDINLTSQCQEEINTDDVQQLEIEENSSDKIDETVSHEKTETSTTEAVTINDSITNKASEADGGSSDGSLKTCNDTGRDLDVSSVITASKEESVNENMEDHTLALPAQDENTPEHVLYLEKTEREMSSSQKILPTEPEENQIPNESNEDELQDENPIPNEKNEEDVKDAETGDAQKDVEQDLPVSHFLMNLILGKKNGDADENSESVAERKHGETTEDNSCVLISKQEESAGSLSTENKVDDDLTFEQEKYDVKCSEETQEMVKEQSDDLKLDNERSIHTDEESNKNTRDLEILTYQGNPEDKISGEVSSEEASRVSTKMETRDIEISNLELDDKEVDTVCQEETEASTKIENGSLKNNMNDLINTEASEQDTLGEGETGLLPESLPEDKSADAVSEKTPLLTESGMVDEKDLSCDAEAVQDLACAKEDATTEPSIKATITPDIQLECEEVEKKEEEQNASKATSEVYVEDAEISDDNVQKSTISEVTSDEQAPQITEPVSDTQKILAHEKEISEGSTCMDEKESSNLSIKGVENFQTAVEIQADGPNMQVNQDKKDEVADNKTTMEPEKLGKSEFQEHQETATEQKSPKATDEGDHQLLVKKENMIKEEVVPRTVESHEQTVSIKSNEEQELFDSKVQERDLNVVSPREASAAEENFVDVTKPEFSTDEEQSPKADAEEKTYDEKIKDFTDEAAMKTEVPGATQKARKKQNLLSGVGSKVKQQLAKVKKAIVRKPGNTKPDSPKS